MNSSSLAETLSAGHRALVFFVALLLWMLLAGRLDAQEWAAGSLVALMLVILFSNRLAIFNAVILGWSTPLHILVYLAYFSVALIRANFELAVRVLTPSLPINPELVRIKTPLQSRLGRMLLANTITLTPGTLTVELQEDELLVHWVYCPPGLNEEQIRQRVAGNFSELLGKFLR